MIVSHQHRFVFIKTRKTAGTSIEIALAEHCGPADIITPIDEVDEQIRRELGHRGPQNFEVRRPASGLGGLISRLFGRNVVRHYNHAPASLIRARIGPQSYDSYRKFCVVRNPWDRAVSLYFWRKNRPGSENLDKEMSFAEFVRDTPADVLSDAHIFTIDGAAAVDRFVRYENLAEDLTTALAELDLPAIDLPWAKSGTRETKDHYSWIFDDESEARIRELCAWEIDNLGYEFDDRRGDSEE
jgi:hypothetical protein|tara:strand:+ start:441 stop:1166 length:726 start_codon:yes stop_codon:yes gene_type:complete